MVDGNALGIVALQFFSIAIFLVTVELLLQTREERTGLDWTGKEKQKG